LMLQYRDGDLRAFRELYGRHRVGLYRFIAWRSPRAEWVDEIVQDAWAGLHHARSRYRPDASFRTYLYQIARNRLLDLLRQHQHVLAAELGAGTDGRDLFDVLADAAQDVVAPDAALEGKQRSSSLHSALAALPGEQREAVVLQQFSGLSVDEIAELAAVPVETVRSRLRYAMRKLRLNLSPAAASQGEQA
ncbi:MAG: sigma-70 family RNA polymerase sigma factor, partial [Pseudomonadota bacterium]|nr:sigma-70 family RNA polymerase sigma factor [Pseudomonadota bacterium]